MIAFWFILLTGKQSKLSLLVYNLLLNDMNSHVYNNKWIVFVKSILDDAGYTHIWISQCEGITSESVFKNILMQGLHINSFSHGMHTLTTNPKLQIINYSNIHLHSKHISQFWKKHIGVL